MKRAFKRIHQLVLIQLFRFIVGDCCNTEAKTETLPRDHVYYFVQECIIKMKVRTQLSN